MFFVHMVGWGDTGVNLPQKIGAERLAFEINAQSAALADESEALSAAFMPHDRPGIRRAGELIKGIVLVGVRVGQAVVDDFAPGYSFASNSASLKPTSTK